jgi:hypothetical protein
MEGILQEAMRITGGERAENYGHPRANHERIAQLWNGYVSAKAVDKEGKLTQGCAHITAQDVVVMMILLKAARELHTSKRDNWVDMAGYARCGARIAGHEAWWVDGF